MTVSAFCDLSDLSSSRISQASCCSEMSYTLGDPEYKLPKTPLLRLFFVPLPCSAQLGRTGALGCGGSASGLTLTTGTGFLS